MEHILNAISNIDRSILLQEWMTFNGNLTNFEKRKISIPFNMAQLSSIKNLDSSKIVANAIKNEIIQDITKKITKELFNTKKFDYIDIRSIFKDQVIKEPFSDKSFNDKLANMITDSGYSNLITSPRFSTFFYKNISFFNTPTNNSSSNAIQDFIGVLFGATKAYIDRYMHYDECKICLFDKAEINISEIRTCQVVSANTFAPTIIVEYDIDFCVGDSMLILIVESETSEVFKQYQSLQRDIKLNDILNEKE